MCHSTSKDYLSRSAFTLLELIAVMVCISILAAAMVVFFHGRGRDTNEAKCRSELQVIQIGLEEYRGRFGDYPRIPNTFPDGVTTNNGYLLNALWGRIGPGGDVLGSGEIVPSMLNHGLLQFEKTGFAVGDKNVIDNTIVDPWGNPYVYRYPRLDEFFGYELYSVGPDGSDSENADNMLAE